MPKRASIEFISCSEPDGAGLRFGGEPYGLPKELWPVSKRQGEPMQCICQIPFGPELFPETTESVAYLFMTTGDGDQTWVPLRGRFLVSLIRGLSLLPVEQVGQMCLGSHLQSLGD